MRSATFGLNPSLPQSSITTEEETLEMFKKISLCRAFELETKKAFDKGLIKMPIYLSLGQESISSALSVAMPNAKQFAQHRCHDTYLCWGGDPEKLIDELLHLPTGCAGGMGGSASIHSPATGMFGHDGHMGTQIPIATWYSYASQHQTVAIMGDASAEEGYVQGALGEAGTRKPPILFVCADNNLSILTPVSDRRNWDIVDTAKAKGMPAINITDDPWLILETAKRFIKKLPAFLNIYTCRVLWHAGTGQDGEPEWDRYQYTIKEMDRLGLSKRAMEIWEEVNENIIPLWSRRIKEVTK
jgi:acetoin:2,6-dichlorophenolindophenol oxidoreductase subunit alpha